MTEERCPRCHGKGTVVKDGPHDDEYDSHYPCPRCTTDRAALKGTGWVPVARTPALQGTREPTDG